MLVCRERAHLEAEGNDGREYSCHRLIAELIDGNDVKVSQEAWGDGVTPTPRGTHGTHELQVDQRDLAGVLLVIPVPSRKRSCVYSTGDMEPH